MAAPPTDAKKQPLGTVIVRRLLITLAVLALMLVPMIVLLVITRQPAATYAAMASMIGIFAVLAGSTRMGVITVIVTALLAPLAIVAGLTPFTGAVLMTLMALVVGRLTIFGLHRAAMLVPIFLAWLILAPVPWLPLDQLDRINALLAKHGTSIADVLNRMHPHAQTQTDGPLARIMGNALMEQRLDQTYLIWIAVIFLIGGLFPVVVLPFALRRFPLPKAALIQHSRREAVPYTITIAVLTGVATYWCLDHPKMVAGSFLIATILVLTQVGGEIKWRLTVERVIGTIVGAVAFGLAAQAVGGTTYGEVLGMPFPLRLYAIGLLFGALAILAKFSPRLWIYYVLIVPAAAALNAFSFNEAANFGEQRLVDNVVGAALVIAAALITLGASRLDRRRDRDEPPSLPPPTPPRRRRAHHVAHPRWARRAIPSAPTRRKESAMTKSAGALLAHEEIATSITGARAHRVRYASKDVNGVATESTGLVIAPVAAGSDRPVMTWTHGTTGIGDAACPSAQPDPARELITYFDIHGSAIDYGVPCLQSFIDDGWVVCATDYQGLGTPGVHQYSVNRTNGRDGLYIVHAARALDVGMGAAVAGAGWSQGGAAIAALTELDADEYGNLDVFAAVAFSPGVAGAALKSGSGATMANPNTPIDAHAFMVIAGLAAAYPDALRLDDLLTPLGIEIATTTYDELTVHHLDDVLARSFHHLGPILRPDPQNLGDWKDAVLHSTAGQRTPVCPILICEDLGNPEGRFPCPLPWQDAYAADVRALGGEVEVRTYPDDDHFSLCRTAMPDAKAWLESKRPQG